MSCEFNAGNDAKLQLGLGGTWGTKAAATISLPFDTEGLKYMPKYAEANAKIGNTLTSRMEITSEHVEGDITTWFTPEVIRMLIYAALGKEYSTIDGPAASTYKHYYSPLKSGGACLPMLSAEVDRLKEVMTYDSLKVNSLSLKASKEDYVIATVSFVGHDEADAGALTAGINLSSLEYFKFRGAKVYADVGSGSVEMEDVSDIEFSYENNLVNDRFTSKKAGKLSEINPQGRASSLKLTVYLSTAINAIRKTIFKTGATMAVELTFEIGDMVTGSTPYEVGILLPYCYLPEVPYNIDSSDEISFDLAFTVTDPDDVDFVGAGTGLDGQVINLDIGDKIESGVLVKVLDEDGQQRTYKYISTSVTAVGAFVTFDDDGAGVDTIGSIFLAGPLFNDAEWEMANGVNIYTIDGESTDLV